MNAALEDKNSSRYRIFLKELRAVFARDERLYKFVCERLPSQALKWQALGLPKAFHSKENMQWALYEKNSSRYAKFITDLKAVYARDERLYKFVWESLPLDALDKMVAGSLYLVDLDIRTRGVLL